MFPLTANTTKLMFSRSPTDLDDAGLWPTLSRGFTQRLPLTNLTWQSATSRRQRIAELDIPLVPFSAVAGNAGALGKTADKMGALASDHTQPFLHLFIVNCEVSRSSRICLCCTGRVCVRIRPFAIILKRQ